MNQNQCVPTWDLDDVGPTPPPQPPPAPPPCMITSRSLSTSMSTALDTSLLDYEVAELTWKNGQLAMHGLGLPRVPSKPNLVGAWPGKTATRASGTLESIVNQAIAKPQQPPPIHDGACENDAVLVPCFDQCASGGAVSGPVGSISMTMDALVPTGNVSHNTYVGSCSAAAAAAARVPVGSEWSVSLSGSRRRERLKRRMEDTCEIVDGDLTYGLTSTSFGTSPENTKTVAFDDYDSVCHTITQGERMEEEENGNNKASAKSSMSTKRSRAAAVHNQSERKRRDKINQRMKALQKLVPNSNKTDKASMLDEAIEYLKQLQAQVQMMSRMSIPPSMMMPMAAMQQLQMSSMMSQMGMAGMGMPMPAIAMAGMDPINMAINSMTLTRPNSTQHAQNGVGNSNGTLMNPSSFMPSPLATWDCPSVGGGGGVGGDADRLVSTSQQHSVVPADPFTAAFLACQSQPMTMDTYSRSMAAMYQQLQQLQQPPGCNN